MLKWGLPGKSQYTEGTGKELNSADDLDRRSTKRKGRGGEVRWGEGRGGEGRGGEGEGRGGEGRGGEGRGGEGMEGRYLWTTIPSSIHLLNELSARPPSLPPSLPPSPPSLPPSTPSPRMIGHCYCSQSLLDLRWWTAFIIYLLLLLLLWCINYIPF